VNSELYFDSEQALFDLEVQGYLVLQVGLVVFLDSELPVAVEIYAGLTAQVGLEA